MTVTVLPDNVGFATAYTATNAVDQAHRDAILDVGAQIGAVWCRMDVSHSGIENAGPGQRNWTNLDATVKAARARNQKIIGTLCTSPPWNRPAGTDYNYGPDTADRRSAFATFAAAAVARYQADIQWWEIWNEENAVPFWKTTPNPINYGLLVVATAQAIRGASPTAKVMLGGLAATGNTGGDIDPETFLAQMTDQAVQAVDSVALHATTYPAIPSDPSTASWNIFLRLPRIHDNLVARGQTGQVWISEWGHPTIGTITGAQQAAALVDGLQLQAGRSWAGPTIVYMPIDKGTGNSDPDQNYGVVTTGGAHKAAFDALKNLLATPVEPPPVDPPPTPGAAVAFVESIPMVRSGSHTVTVILTEGQPLNVIATANRALAVNVVAPSTAVVPMPCDAVPASGPYTVKITNLTAKATTLALRIEAGP